MDMKNTLLILSVLMSITGGHGALNVILYPRFPQLYVGDDVTFRCVTDSQKDPILDPSVQWYFNNGSPVQSTDGVLHKAFVTVKDSGDYQCEFRGEKSTTNSISVKDMVPPAVLSEAKTSATVITTGGEVILKLEVKEGVKGWVCRFTKPDGEYQVPLNEEDNTGTTLFVHTYPLDGMNSSIYWCKRKDNTMRSNIVILTATEKIVSLQVSANPVFEGDSVTLRCEVWGGPQIVQTFFYKDGNKIKQSNDGTYVIQNINSSSIGTYICTASYKYSHIDPAAATQSDRASDRQILRVIAGPPAAALKDLGSSHLSCSCDGCSGSDSYCWYLSKKLLHCSPSSTLDLHHQEEGSYTCRVAWGTEGLSRPSNEIVKEKIPAVPVWMVMMVVLLVLLMVVVVGVFIFRRRQDTQTSLKKVEEGKDGGYEQLTMKEATYHTLKGGAENKEGGDGGYEALTVKEGTYHTLKGEAEKKEGGDGGYEALSVKEGTYHTLKGEAKKKDEGAGGGYEALKLSQEQKDKDEYQTLPDQSQSKDQYQTLQNVQAEVYHTIKNQGQEAGGAQEAGAGQAEGGYEQLPQKETVEAQKEDNPYEELKAEQQGKRKTVKDKK